jgi:beta-N-acetylhexosaminidase
MTDSEKVAQLFLARADGDDLDFILEKNPGGLVMFGSNFKDKSKDEVKDEIKGYQEKSEIPLIIAVDEEGGTVVRVSSDPALSDEKFLSPQEYYNEGGAELAVEKEKKKCGILKELGINMNLAPVADVSLSPSDFIYDRSLGQSAEITSQYIGEVVAEMKNEGMASCLKHFPGYGSNADTHTGIAVDERPMRTFQNSDFLPFMTGIEAGADAVLVSHNIVTCMDAELPSSLSPAVHDILRSDLEFDGLIITDDMSMDAVKDYGEPYVKAVNAGNNLIITGEFEAAYNEVMGAVEDGRISGETLDSAVKKTLEWKEDRF